MNASLTRLSLLRDRTSYQAYRGGCSYRGFSLSGCSTTGEIVMLRIMATPEHFSLVSTSLRWRTRRKLHVQPAQSTSTKLTTG